jgi:hypothetical protein
MRRFFGIVNNDNDRRRLLPAYAINKIFEDQYSGLYLFNTSDLVQEEFKNWDKNRPPDPVRVSRIINYYVTHNVELIPGIIYVWPRSAQNSFLVYDGIHRLCAAFEHGGDTKVLIQFRYTDREQDIIDDFLDLNKSISVPVVYLENDNYTKKTMCERLAQELCVRHPEFVSSSRNHYRYNFNRDKMIDFFSSLEIDFTKASPDVIMNELEGLNVRAREYVKRNTIKHPQKCVYHNFFLFFLDMALIKSSLESVVNNY